MSTARDQFIAGMSLALGGDASLWARPGVTVQPRDDRAENHVTAAYRLGEHLVISCDPAATEVLQEMAVSLEPTLDAFAERAPRHGGEWLGAVRMQTMEASHPVDALVAEGYRLATLDVHDDTDRALIQALVDVTSEDDADDAELDMAALDDGFHVVLDGDGAIAAFASARPWDEADGFGDIGVLTRHDQRGRGLGRAVVAALCRDLIAQGLRPLYRCDEENHGSVGLSASLGFDVATQLVAVRFNPADQ